MYWPTVQDVLAVNAACIAADPVDRKHGGGVRVPGLVEGVLDQTRPSSGADRDELVRSAAGLMHALALAHPFQGCNKRTAFIVMAATLAENGVQLTMPPGEIAAFMRSLTATRPPRIEVEEWLRKFVGKT